MKPDFPVFLRISDSQYLLSLNTPCTIVETLQVPSKKQNKTTLQLTDENSETHAVITVGNSREVEPEKASRDDAGKPLYLRRI